LNFVYTKAFENSPPRPYLDVVLRHGFLTSNKLMALVDSGADYPIFPKEVADELKLDLSVAPIWHFSGTTGKSQEARLAEACLAILGEDDESHPLGEFKATCAFCADFKFSGGALLGQNGFFSNFLTCFNQPKNCFDLQPIRNVTSLAG
jgi:hypothetical protein